MKPKVLVLRTAGTNCDQETAFAFSYFGAKVDLVHVNQLRNGQKKLIDYHICALPGGFTYGDNIESGRVLANEIENHFQKAFQQFVKDGKLIIGICNGFQVLVKAGILPGVSSGSKQAKGKQSVTLTNNDSGRFEDRWSYLNVEGDSVWTKDLPRRVYFPVAHAEGKLSWSDRSVLKRLDKNKQIVFRYIQVDGESPQYPENPNGSYEDITGITDPTGRVLGLMPHPERHFFFEHHPFWTRLKKTSDLGDGAQIFANGIEYIKKHF